MMFKLFKFLKTPTDFEEKLKEIKDNLTEANETIKTLNDSQQFAIDNTDGIKLNVVTCAK